VKKNNDFDKMCNGIKVLNFKELSDNRHVFTGREEMFAHTSVQMK
jgi:hypothetical protein